MPTSHRTPDDGKHRLQPGGTDLRGSVANVEPRQPRSYAGLLIRRGHEEATKVLGRYRIGASRKAEPRFRDARPVRAARLVPLSRRKAVEDRMVRGCVRGPYRAAEVDERRAARRSASNGLRPLDAGTLA